MARHGCIVFGPSFSSGRRGKLAIVRTHILLREAEIDVAVELHND
jgi:hypothetical protein